jgi:hypothetical protein
VGRRDDRKSGAQPLGIAIEAVNELTAGTDRRVRPGRLDTPVRFG